MERGSLYATFGDKRRFYLETVKLYWAEYERQLVGALAAKPLLPALRDILVLAAEVGQRTTGSGQPHGCLMGNTAAELVPHDADAHAIVADSFSRFTSLVSEALDRAQHDGEVVKTASPQAQAHLLLFLAQGVSLVSRTGLDPAVSIAAIDAAIAGLRSPACC